MDGNTTKDTNGKRIVTGMNRRNEFLIVLCMLVILCAVIGVVVWQTREIGQNYVPSRHVVTSEPHYDTVTWPLKSGSVILNTGLKLAILNNGTTLEGILNYQMNISSPSDCRSVWKTDICLEWKKDRRLNINFTRNTLHNIDCYDIHWTAIANRDQVLIDCINTTNAHWYGGYADKVQAWPFETTIRTMAAYVANDSYIGEIGGVLERYFFSSKGSGIFLDSDVPLYFSMNNPRGTMCFAAKYERYPYLNYSRELPHLKYTICQADNVRDIHLSMASKFIPHPKAIPNENLFRYPIWSTWAQFHKYINQSKVVTYTNAILHHNFTHAQIEIDDNWTPAYGDMVFNDETFPNATGMIKELNDLGFRVTVWVHPFFNLDSHAFVEAASHRYLIREFDSPQPALTSWWDGLIAGILDPSNPDAVKWYLDKLETLKTTYNVSSFKFDAGEASWLPHLYSSFAAPEKPGEIYPKAWVALAEQADKSHRQEVRVGYRTQKHPIFVRMMDKFSNWGHDNGLKSVIPCALTFGILGYPFVLPDMIGGNAYDNLPDPELYIRWLQLNTFLPSMQFSIPPWLYNYTVIDIAIKFTRLHEQYSDMMIDLANESVRTGHPIIRPLWWLDPYSESGLTCEDEFLVGDQILVAPVVDQGARQRSIYLPPGSWLDNLNNVTVEGGMWLMNFLVDIDELAYFTKVTSVEY